MQGTAREIMLDDGGRERAEDAMVFVEIDTDRAKRLVSIQHSRRVPVALGEVPGTLVS